MSSQTAPLLHSSLSSHALDAPASIATSRLDLLQIHAMASFKPAPTVSVYVRTHREGRQQGADLVRCHQLLAEARTALVEGIGGPRTTRLLGTVIESIERPNFWQHAHDGLALFCREDDFRYLWLPAAVDEQVVIGTHHHLKPLMPLLQGDGRFHLLELSQKGIRLFKGSRFGLSPIELVNPPLPMSHAAGLGDHDRHTQVRTIHGTGEGAGHYSSTIGDLRPKDDIAKYFHAVDAYIGRLLHGERTPLVIAGVEYLLPIYREVNRFPHLLAQGIARNPVPCSLAEIHDLAWDIVAPVFAAAEASVRDRYAQLSTGERASGDLATLLVAAHQGRVEELLVAINAERWGRFDPVAGTVHESRVRHAIDDDLLNLAMIAALNTRAGVQVLDRDLILGRSEIAGILRY